MSDIEPTIDNVQPGDTVTVETGVLGEPGYKAFTVRATGQAELVVHTRSLDWVATRAKRDGYRITRITRITRPALPVPTTPGTRFWAVGSSSQKPREYLVTGARAVVALDWGTQWDLADFPYTVVPAPEPETVPVPARLIRRAEKWNDALREAERWEADTNMRIAKSTLREIVRAVREREGES